MRLVGKKEDWKGDQAWAALARCRRRWITAAASPSPPAMAA
jgi:hypothetical protein